MNLDGQGLEELSRAECLRLLASVRITMVSSPFSTKFTTATAGIAHWV